MRVKHVSERAHVQAIAHIRINYQFHATTVCSHPLTFHSRLPEPVLPYLRNEPSVIGRWDETDIDID